MSSELAQSLRAQMIAFIDDLPVVAPADYQVRQRHSSLQVNVLVCMCEWLTLRVRVLLCCLCQLSASASVPPKRGQEWDGLLRQPSKFPSPEVATNMFATTVAATKERIEEVRATETTQEMECRTVALIPTLIFLSAAVLCSAAVPSAV